jgi:oxalate decarboxylase
VAVLHYRQGPHDGFHCRHGGPHDGFFEEGDVGYIPISNPHYSENTGDSDLVFLEMFKSANYQDISLAEWMAHTPHLLMDQHLQLRMPMLYSITKEETVITPV